MSDDEVFVYDSLFGTKPTYHVLKQIAAIVQSRSSRINLHLEKVQFQRNSVDCGIYAITFITDLCYGKDPATCQYSDSKELCQHLLHCFNNCYMNPFPTVASIKKTPSKSVYINVYCSCRLPYVLEHITRRNLSKDETTEMMKCSICDNWYHYNCVNLTLNELKRMKTSKEFWMCHVQRMQCCIW